MQKFVYLAVATLPLGAGLFAGLAGAADAPAVPAASTASASESSTGAVAGDVTAGRRAFNRNCRACHQVETGAGSALGPNLAGILGRAARADGAFEYSPAFAAAAERGVVWDASTLERYLAAPTAMIPGSKMPLAVTDAAQRRDLVAYLATLSP